jgi:hypothetical protein
MSGASNAYGRCEDASVWMSREQDANAIGDGFRSVVSNVPYVGGIVAGLIPDTYTANAVRMCPGATVDHTTPYSQTYALMAVLVGLIVIYLIIGKK